MLELNMHYKHEMIGICQRFQRNFELTVFELTVPDLYRTQTMMSFILAMTLAQTGLMNIKECGVNYTPSRTDRAESSDVHCHHCQLVLLSLFLPFQVILELMRYMTTTPLLVPHSTTTDVELVGYYLPKDTRVSRAGWHVVDSSPAIFLATSMAVKPFYPLT